MKIEGNLIITRENAPQYAALTTVGRDLYIHADAQMPALTTVGGKPYSAGSGT